MIMDTIDRRDFVRFIGAGSAGLLLAPAILRACKANGNGNEDCYVNFDGIMPIAMVTDCSRLLLDSGKLSPEITEALTADINLPLTGNLSRLGSSIPFDDESVFTVLEELRQNMGSDPEKNLRKLSMILGWMIFRPLKKAMTDIVHKLVEQGYHYDNIRAYIDTYLMRQFSGDRQGVVVSSEEVQDLLNNILARMITRLHTLKPDYIDGLGWVNRISDWREENHLRMDKYGTLIVEDDQELLEHVIRKYNVYHPGDRLIALVRSDDSGEGTENVEKVILSDPGNSIYAKSLVKGYNNVLRVQDYLQGNIELSKLKKLL